MSSKLVLPSANSTLPLEPNDGADGCCVITCNEFKRGFRPGSIDDLDDLDPGSIEDLDRDPGSVGDLDLRILTVLLVRTDLLIKFSVNDVVELASNSWFDLILMHPHVDDGHMEVHLLFLAGFG